MLDEQKEGLTPETPDVVPETNETEAPGLTLSDAPAEATSQPAVEQPDVEPVETPSAIEPVSEPVVTPGEAAPTPAQETTVPTGVIGSGPTPTEPMVVSTLPPKKKLSKGALVGIIFAGALVLLGGGTALAYNFWYQNPDKVVSDAIVNAVTAKTVSATGTAEIKAKDYTLKIDVSGRNSLEANSTFAAKVSVKGDGFDYTIDAEALYGAEGDIYLKLNDAEKLAKSFEEQSDGQVSFDVFESVIKKIDSKWVKISADDIGDFSDDLKEAQQCSADISKKLDSDTAFRKQVMDETQDLYKEHPFIVVGDKLGSRTINGQGSLGYTLTGDSKEADAFFTGFGDTVLGKDFKKCNEDVKFEDIISDDFDKENSSTKTEAQIWVSRFGHSITEFNMTAEDDDASGSFVINPVFNKNEAVEVPTDFIPFSELKADIEKAYEDAYSSYYSDYTYESDATATEFN